MAGYSGTPLSKKLGIKNGCRVFVKNAPLNFSKLIEPIPADVKIFLRISNDIDIILFFTKSKKDLAKNIEQLATRLSQAGFIWVSWPKKASKVSTDLSVSTIRDLMSSYGFVDIKVCAIDDVWSGLKLVRRKRIIRQ